MAKVTIGHDDAVSRVDTDKGVTLASGVAYTQGMLVVKQDTGKWTNALIVLSGAVAATPQLSYDEQEIGWLAADVDATLADQAGVVYTGEFNLNKTTFSGAQTLAQTVGILQAKGITLKDWNA